MVNPDAAVCAMIAAAVAPLAGNDAKLYLSLTTELTFLTGVLCIAASYFRLGALADFLSKPILVGFLNGVAISIFLGQIGKMLGFSVESSGIIPLLLEVLRKLPHVHGATLAVGLGSFTLLFACLRWLPRLPAALVVLVVAGGMSAGLQLQAQGVAVLGPVPAGLPQLRWPTVRLQDVPSLVAEAAGLALGGEGRLSNRR
jgi:MFS superfamily sulfate permease-like transporter